MPALERAIEALIFASRWILAPFFLGLLVAMVVLLFKFMKELLDLVLNIWTTSDYDVVISILTLVDTALIAVLLLIIVFSGYESFVSRINTNDHEDRPAWMGKVGDGARPGLRAGGVALHQLEGGRRAIAGVNRLIRRQWRARRQAGLVVAPVLEAEAVQPPVARLEEGDHRGEIVGAADAVGHVIAPARVGPAGVALLVAGGQFHDLGASFRPATRAAADIVREPDIVKRHKRLLR